MIKICGLTDPEAVRAAVHAGAGAVGFVFADSVRCITPAHAAALAADVPPDVLRVAVMQHPSAGKWREVFNVFRPQVLQTDAADFATLDIPVTVTPWPVLREGTFDTDASLPEVFVYEGAASGRGQAVDWRQAAILARRGRMILAGGLNEDNVAEAIATVRPWGVDVSSAVESVPGTKDPARIARFIRAARNAANTEGHDR